ncbi:3'-5' exonuclease [Solitalea longa]|uniref:3'-5' exonuclease n=1 Tax=Solitalea longa TaxID=2079460 RepID=A0A2S5A639_9SPHI|nr:ribonuclease H-like domain-containing protein [Solitalea longa]POY38060.1 3'-5' exonuclease [Solitalea longa]
MLNNLSVKNIFFIDIETVSQSPDFNQLDQELQQLWEIKSGYFRKEDQAPADVYQRAAIYAEFGKIICISIGRIIEDDEGMKFRVKSFYGDDEKDILTEFANLLNRQKHTSILCAHNGKEFDFPYLSRRMLINGVEIPELLNNAGKKPWETNFLDTMELWKFGDYKNYTSLRLLAAVFNIPTPKDDIDGSMVGQVYWLDQDLERIRTYCEKDVITVAQILLKFKGKPLIEVEKVERV